MGQYLHNQSNPKLKQNESSHISSPAANKGTIEYLVLTKRKNKNFKERKKKAKNSNKTKPRVLKNKFLSRN